jgi:glycine hydroxymethyltransferase
MPLSAIFPEMRWLIDQDKEVASAIDAEFFRQSSCINLIASENYASREVMAAQGSILTNKYAEGYSGRRYYGGCQEVDRLEDLATSRAAQLFKVKHVNVQPHSGAQANLSVFFALLNPQDTVLGMALDAGGHLTHGAAPTISGRWFNPVLYRVNPETGLIDMDEVRELARQHRPKLIVAGASSYPRVIDFAAFREIADEVGAYLLADIAHYAGLVVADLYPSPIPYAHVVTTTTHKTLRGARGGMIMTNDDAMAKKLNSAVFPGVQGGPLMHIIAAKAVGFGEALKPEFKEYAERMLANARDLADELQQEGVEVMTGGTDCHMVLVNLQKYNVSGKDVQESLERANIICNKNAIPNDPRGPGLASGVRLGSPSATARGLGGAEFRMIANMVAEIIKGVAANGVDGNGAVEASVLERVLAICDKHPIYPAI